MATGSGYPFLNPRRQPVAVIRDLRALGSPGNEESWLVTSADSLKVGDEACRDGDLAILFSEYQSRPTLRAGG